MALRLLGDRRPKVDPATRLAELLAADVLLARGLHRELVAALHQLRDVDRIKPRPEFLEVIDLLRRLAWRHVPTHVPGVADRAHLAEEFASVSEAAGRLGWSSSYTRRQCRAGRLPAVQVEGAWLVRRDALPPLETVESA